MRTGLILLAVAYVLSQFFRAFLAVLATPLEADIGVSADGLATASGLWFLTFAAMQIPVGWALDTIGPRRTAAYLLLIGGGGGAALFASATSVFHINAAMMLIGVGCSPVLMASYYIFAREFPPKQFATLAALMIGVGTTGNLIASYPMALSAEIVGWRSSLWALAVLSILIAGGIHLSVRDPAQMEGGAKGSVLDLLKIPALWLIMPLMFVNYAPAAAVRGLWIGPYLRDIYGLTQAQIGSATLIMGLAMIAGVLVYGPLDRIFGSRKWVVFAGNLGCAVALGALALMPEAGMITSVALMAAVGLFGASFPVMIAHARGFFPPHLMGRGVTLMNLFGIGGVGVMQFASGQLQAGASTAPSYATLFVFFALTLAMGLVIYLFSKDTAG